MTQALCLKCGTFKDGAFNACESCGFSPVDDQDLAYSLALTDHYFALETLREIGRAIPDRGRPSLPPEQEQELLATVRNPHLQRILGIAAARQAATKKGSGTSKGGILRRWLGR
jgi:hypothetical protein